MNKKIIIKAFQGEKTKETPFWFLRQAGRYLPEYQKIKKQEKDMLDLFLNPKKATTITLQPVKRFQTSAAIIFSDILMVPYGLGQSLCFDKKKGPRLGNILDKPILKFDKKKFDALLSPVYKTISITKKKLNKQTALIGFSGSPWTLLSFMLNGGPCRGANTIKKHIGKPYFEKYINLLVRVVVHYINKQIDHGAEAIQLFDTYAGMLKDKKQIDKYIFKTTKKIVSEVKKKNKKIPIIGFPKGLGCLYKDFVKITGVDVINIDQSVSLAWALKELRGRAVLQGNLSPETLRLGGRKLDEEVLSILRCFGRGPFVFNLSHGIRPNTPVKNVSRVCFLLRGGVR